jgi:ribosome-binding protein aMBF1 (putative translation factor)
VTIVERFGRNVAAARAFRRMGQAGLAKEIGHDQSHVSLIESGKREVGIVLADRIAEAVGVGVEDLMYGEPFSPPAPDAKEGT